MNGRVETPDPSGGLRPYEYDNPGENARGLPAPDATTRDRYGNKPGDAQPGTPEHVYPTWFAYQDRKERDLAEWNRTHTGRKPSAALGWDTWLGRYIANMGWDPRGKAYEKRVVEEIGLGGDHWICQGDVDVDGKVRRYDAVNHKEGIAYEFKSGRTIDAGELAKDSAIAKSGRYKVVYVFGDQPTKATIGKLRAAGVDYHVMRATPVATNPFKPDNSPSSRIMNPDPAVPSRGAFNDTVRSSGRTLDEAREVAAVDDEMTTNPKARAAQMRRPGGIDFSTMQLRYVSDSGGLQYSFEANDIEDATTEPSFGGMQAAQLSSDALFTWLALPSSSFWVNLNPDTPDQIIDPVFATTDAGRVLLQADLALKTTHVQLLNPDTALGAQFWDAVHFNTPTVPCLPLRLWITAGPASVRDDNGQLYILDAPLKVNAEFFKVQNWPDGTAKCEQTDAQSAENVATYQKIILPAMEQAVNTRPEYADLRRVYMSRVAAEWLRQRAAQHPNAVSAIIGSGDVSRWPVRTPWKPSDVYNQYIQSIKDGIATYHRTVKDGTETIDVTLVFGGVDFDKAPQQPVSGTVFKQQAPMLPATVTSSTSTPVGYTTTNRTLTLLGGGNLTQPTTPKPTAPPPGGSAPTLPITGTPVVTITGIGLFLLIGGAFLVWRQRRITFRA
ncbi:LPXTG cell wall anchor domain-containing protein [Planosporangium sp. 12N6]|uniref:LPXTG cell wall anchor domain-containing protein n=1 Tax=Planosporangium spinosum TaxID=3402278 RepID=UPI003CF7249E